MAPERPRIKSATAAFVIVVAATVGAVGLVSTQSLTKAGEVSSTSSNASSASSSSLSSQLAPIQNYTTTAAQCSNSSQVSPTLELALGNATISFVTTRFDGGTTTYPGSEAFPVTVTSATPVEVDLSALCVPAGVWVHFDPAHVTASAAGTVSTMTVADAVQPLAPLGPGSPHSTIFVQAAPGATLSSVPLIVRVLDSGMTALSSPGPIFLMHPIEPTINQTGASDFGVVYDPNSAAAPPLQATFSVAGMLLDNGTRVALPQWMHVLLVNSSLSLVPYQPEYFTFAAGAYSQSPGSYPVSYQVLIDETVGGQQFIVVLGAVAEPIVVGNGPYGGGNTPSP